jgi:hypothetical protein
LIVVTLMTNLLGWVEHASNIRRSDPSRQTIYLDGVYRFCRWEGAAPVCQFVRRGGAMVSAAFSR